MHDRSVDAWLRETAVNGPRASVVALRMTLVPAVLTLLRERSWYIPRWLDRVLPAVTIEPPHDARPPAGVCHEHPAEMVGRP